jgi:hypothetical protein
VRVCVCVRENVCVRIYLRTHARAHTNTHTHTHIHTYIYTIDQHFHLESSGGASEYRWDGAGWGETGGGCMPPAVQGVDEIVDQGYKTVDQGYKIVDHPCLAGHVRWRLLFHCCISHPSGCMHASSSSSSSLACTRPPYPHLLLHCCISHPSDKLPHIL